MWMLDEIIRHDDLQTVWETILTNVISKQSLLSHCLDLASLYNMKTLWKGSNVPCLFSQPSWSKNKINSVLFSDCSAVKDFNLSHLSGNATN